MKQTGSNHSVEKTLKIIETLAMSPQPMRLSDIAAAVGMPASTVLRMVNTLVECGYAYQEKGIRRYALTMRFLHIGQIAADHFSIRDIAHPYLLQISAATGEASCLAILDSGRLCYLDVVEGNGNLIAIRQRIGGSGPMHATGSGKLFLMQYTPEELDRFIEAEGLPALTVHTLTDKQGLLYDLEQCRNRGYANDEEECEIGMRCVAAPILSSSGKVIASISISGPISRMTKLRRETELVPMLCEAAQKISCTVSGEIVQPETRQVS